MSAPASPHPSCHAKLRLLQRAGVDAGSLMTAWTDGVAVGLEGRAYHHAKYNEALGVVLLEREGVIVTVLRAAYEKFMEENR